MTQTDLNKGSNLTDQLASGTIQEEIQTVATGVNEAVAVDLQIVGGLGNLETTRTGTLKLDEPIITTADILGNEIMLHPGESKKIRKSEVYFSGINGKDETTFTSVNPENGSLYTSGYDRKVGERVAAYPLGMVFFKRNTQEPHIIEIYTSGALAVDDLNKAPFKVSGPNIYASFKITWPKETIQKFKDILHKIDLMKPEDELRSGESSVQIVERKELLR